MAQYSLEGIDLRDTTRQWLENQLPKEQHGVYEGQFGKLSAWTPGNHAFYLTREWTPSTIHFRGKAFNNILLLYDIHAQNLFTRHPDQLMRSTEIIRMNPEHVSEFRLLDRKFIYLESDLLLFENGFHEVIYEGENISLYAFRKKYLEADEERLYYKQSDRYHLFYRGEMRSVKGRRTFVKLMDDRRSIRRFIWQNNLDLKASIENDADLETIAAYIDRVTQ